MLALYGAERAPRVADPVSCAIRLQSLSAFWCADDRPAGVSEQDWAKMDGSLASIRRTTCAAYVAWRTSQRRRGFKDPAKAPFVTDQTALRELQDLSAAMGWWNQEHPLTRTPIVTLPEKAESPRDALTRAQAARLLMAARGYRWSPDKVRPNGSRGGWIRPDGPALANRRHLRRFLLIGLYTGTRPGVIPQLLWEESATQAYVDLDAGMIYRRGRRERDKPTKRRPVVKLPRRLLAHMRRWREADRRREAQMIAAHLKAGGRPEAAHRLLSVIHFNGQPIGGRIRRGFKSLVQDAGLEGLALDATPHWMRHTCCTWLMEADGDPWEAAAYAGMSTLTLEKIYGHHRPSHQAGPRRAFGG